MHKSLKTVLALLDGTPTAVRGQALVETLFTIPIFLIMLAGLAEVGWYANNYLILTDVVRSAARVGSTLDPLTWTEGDERLNNRLDCDIEVDRFDKVFGENNTTPPIGSFSNGSEADLGFYDSIACNAIANLAPLEFDDDTDDIVISVFSYVTMHNAICGGSSCIRVAGRYPARSNECSDAGDTFDPFDVDRNGVRTDPFEPANMFDGAVNEGIRGYSFRLNQKARDSGSTCIGSRFSTPEVERLLNQSVMKELRLNVNMSSQESRFFPNYGFVLVELEWHSYQLLGLPFLTIAANPIVARTWTIFPVSAAEPNIDCRQWQDFAKTIPITNPPCAVTR
jgi:hypothetical protein